jgi:hypothetical protein
MTLDERLERIGERIDGLALTVELNHAEFQAFLAKMDIYIARMDRRIERMDKAIDQHAERMKQIEANHTILIQLVDGQQSRLARLEDRQ